MKKIIFKHLPSTDTPIDATNLNAIQDNTEEAINGVIESGSNENGSWIKYSDGTMICRGGKRFASKSPSANPFGYHQYTNWYTFPVKFIGKPDVVPGVTSIDTINVGNEIQVGEDSCNIIVYTPGTSSEVINIETNYIAIGRWK